MRQCDHCSNTYADDVARCPEDGAALRVPDPLLGILIGGKYRVERLLGSGGMGSVYKALDVKLDRPTAVKILNGSYDGASAGLRFTREAQAVARLKHPNIVTCYEFDVSPEVGAYLALEYVEGRSLREELDERGRLSVEESVDLACQVGSALDEAHAKGVVHRDLKPENIFLEAAKDRRAAKVLDFGIAKIAESTRTSRITSDDLIVGTPAYMSPEQCESGEVDGRSDVYSLGCVLYELLTGRPPFDGESATAVFSKHRSVPPLAPSAEAPGLPDSVERVLLRALAKRPEDRHSSAAEFTAELSLSLAFPSAAAEPRADAVRVPTPLARPVTTDAGLPPFTSRFVGREREIGEVVRRLATARLVTLTGVGGIGKTRLAVEAAARVTESYYDGVYLVGLETLGPADALAERVAVALGVREEKGRPLAETLARAIGDRRMLVVLDNCEHLVDACAALARELLRACPRLQILATSQALYGVHGEAVYRVPPLGVPPAGRRLAPEAVAESEAGRLFLDRVRGARPGLEVTTENAWLIGDIIRRLDGLPLAIELVAQQAGLLELDEIAARLDARFELLSGGAGGLRDRHSALKATMEWSYTLLPEAERGLFRRLAVFAGGFTFEAVKGVCGGSGDDGARLERLLSRLVDKSLVVADDSGEPARFHMLETIRQYGHRMLREAGEQARYQTAHADFFLRKAELARAHYYGPSERAWVLYLDGEYDNLRTALEWTKRDDALPTLALRLAGALGRFWELRGYWKQGRRSLEDVLRAHAAPTPTRKPHAEALYWLGVLSMRQGSFGLARGYFNAAIAMLGDARDERGQAAALGKLGLALRYMGETERAAEHLFASLARSRAHADAHGEAAALRSLAMLAADRGEFEEAAWYYDESLAIATRLRDDVTAGTLLQELGELRLRTGQTEAAAELLGRSLSVGERLGSRDIVADASAALGRVAALEGEAARGARWYLDALEIYRRLGNQRGITVVLEGAAYLLAGAGRAREATPLAAAAEAARRSTSFAVAESDREAIDATRARLRSALGPEEFDRLFVAGLGLGVGEAARAARRPLTEMSGAAARATAPDGRA